MSTERHQYDLAHVREELFKAFRESGRLCRLQAHLGIQCDGVARIRDDQEIDFLALFGAPGMLSVGENQSPRVASKPVTLRGDSYTFDGRLIRPPSPPRRTPSRPLPFSGESKGSKDSGLGEHGSESGNFREETRYGNPNGTRQNLLQEKSEEGVSLGPPDET